MKSGGLAFVQVIVYQSQIKPALKHCKIILSKMDVSHILFHTAVQIFPDIRN